MNYHSNSAYISRRSPVASLGGAVATSQPLATQAGVEILRAGGTAADAAVAAAAALQVTQPCSTGLGGDAFCLYFEAGTGTVHALNGSGRSPAALDLARVRADGFTDGIPPFHAHTVTVPGAAAAWEDTVKRFGALSLERVLEPARRLAEEGFPVAPLTSLWWDRGARLQLANARHGAELGIVEDDVSSPAAGRRGGSPGRGDGGKDATGSRVRRTGGPDTGIGRLRGPRAGERFRNPNLATVLERIAEHGARELYEGKTAERIVEAVVEAGGVMSLDDLRAHESEWVTPMSVDYRGVRIWECPPNGQGFAALSALNILTNFDIPSLTEPNARHVLVECMRLAFADAECVVADPTMAGVSRDEYERIVSGLLDCEYGRARAAMIDPVHTIRSVEPGDPASHLVSAGRRGYGAAVGDDTVYLATADRWGNGCSFINSNFMGFGSGIVPRGCGFSLQNRGYGFSMCHDHPNALRPRKRPYHTIIPGIATVGREDGASDDDTTAGTPPHHGTERGPAGTPPHHGTERGPAGTPPHHGTERGPAGTPPRNESERRPGDAGHELYAVFGVMGGMMQPQGHLQVVSALVDGGVDPQAALDQPRFQLDEGDPNGTLLIEESEADRLSHGLAALGHNVRTVRGTERYRFGLGQIIMRSAHGLWAGSDPRGDGLALSDDM